jgi:hypothetical protein
MRPIKGKTIDLARRKGKTIARATSSTECIAPCSGEVGPLSDAALELEG